MSDKPSENELDTLLRRNYFYYFDLKYQQWRHISLRDIPKPIDKPKKPKKEVDKEEE